jgi:hypothetical protein
VINRDGRCAAEAHAISRHTADKRSRIHTAVQTAVPLALHAQRPCMHVQAHKARTTRNTHHADPHTRQQSQECMVHGAWLLLPTSRAELPLTPGQYHPQAKRQEKKAEHSGQHDRRQQAPQDTRVHEATASCAAPRTPTAAVTQPPSRLVLLAAADLAHRNSSSRPARSTSKQGVMIQTAGKAPRHLPTSWEHTLPHTL